MEDIETLAGSKSGLRHLILISALVGTNSADCQLTTYSHYQAAKDQGREKSTLTADFDALSERGWLWFERAGSGIDDVVLTQKGVDAADDFNALRSARRKRAMATRTELLSWLYDCYLAGNQSPAIDGFFGTGNAHFYGSPFTEADVELACGYLHDEGLIAGTKAWGGLIPRPNITSIGVRAVEAESLGNPRIAAGATIVTNHNNHVNFENSHSINVALNSQNVNQSNTVTIEQIKLTKDFIGSTRDLLPALGLSSEQQEAVGEIVDALEAETTSDAPQPSKMKELAGKVVEIVVTGTASGMVNALVAMGEGAILGLG